MEPDLAELRRSIAPRLPDPALQGLAEDVLGHVSVRVGADRLLIRCRGPPSAGCCSPRPATCTRCRSTVRRPICRTATSSRASCRFTPRYCGAAPDVQAVVHAHAPSVIMADLAGLTLRPVIGSYNIPAMRLALAGIPVYPRAVLIRRPDLAAEMLAAMGDAPVCVLRGHGVTTTGGTIAAGRPAGAQPRVAGAGDARRRAGGRPSGRRCRPTDVAELPDLGATLNEEHLWRYHLARLEHAGLAV